MLKIYTPKKHTRKRQINIVKAQQKKRQNEKFNLALTILSNLILIALSGNSN